jgi:hypothetical protein
MTKAGRERVCYNVLVLKLTLYLICSATFLALSNSLSAAGSKIVVLVGDSKTVVEKQYGDLIRDRGSRFVSNRIRRFENERAQFDQMFQSIGLEVTWIFDAGPNDIKRAFSSDETAGIFLLIHGNETGNIGRHVLTREDGIVVRRPERVPTETFAVKGKHLKVLVGGSCFGKICEDYHRLEARHPDLKVFWSQNEQVVAMGTLVRLLFRNRSTVQKAIEVIKKDCSRPLRGLSRKK